MTVDELSKILKTNLENGDIKAAWEALKPLGDTLTKVLGEESRKLAKELMVKADNGRIKAATDIAVNLPEPMRTEWLIKIANELFEFGFYKESFDTINKLSDNAARYIIIKNQIVWGIEKNIDHLALEARAMNLPEPNRTEYLGKIIEYLLKNNAQSDASRLAEFILKNFSDSDKK